MALGKVQSLIVAKLIAMGRLTADQRDSIAARPQDLNGDALDRLLQEDFKVTAFQCLVAKGRALGLAPFNVARYRISSTTFERIPQDFCQENLVLPVGQVGDLLLVAFANPFEVTLPAKIQEMTGKRVVRLLAREKDIKEKFSRANDRSSGFDDVVQQIGAEYGMPGEGDIIKDADVNEESGPIIQLANRIIEDAYFASASDIHVEPQEKDVIVRYRVDGMCQEKLRLPVKVGPALVARIKIMCNLDISERRLPQDGRIVFKQYTKKNLDLDLRVSTAPLNHGEGVVMRILDKQKSTLPLTALGFSEENLAKYRECIRQPYGMILHCGPTGSGKSMTLYSALNEINTPDIVIRTAEDPIEYTLAGINQMQMHRQIGLTFASALRAFLRQDPDVIMVGEIRDAETANIAIHAALTGHLVLTTLHTETAIAAAPRLLDLGVEAFLLKSTLRGVIGQRLVRILCDRCKARKEISVADFDTDPRYEACGFSVGDAVFEPRGCERCAGAGYRGRVGVFEALAVEGEVRSCIGQQVDTNTLDQAARRAGLTTMMDDAIAKCRDGVTTVAEALRVTTAR
jgi:type IV pilus assembly protein PilB